MNFEAMEGRGETETGATWVRLTREYDAMYSVWFFGGVVVINLSPLVCCVREIATLLKSL